jgi:hypothetical protein
MCTFITLDIIFVWLKNLFCRRLLVTVFFAQGTYIATYIALVSDTQWLKYLFKMLEGGGGQNLIFGEVGKFCKSQYNGWGHEGPDIACKIKQIRLQLSVPL